MTICTPEQWEKLKNNDFEGLDKELISNYKWDYLETCVTPNGETIVLFGDYGYEG